MAAQLKADHKEVPLLALFDAVAKYEWAGNGNSGSLKKKFKKFGYNMSLLLKEQHNKVFGVVAERSLCC